MANLFGIPNLLGLGLYFAYARRNVERANA